MSAAAPSHPRRSGALRCTRAPRSTASSLRLLQGFLSWPCSLCCFGQEICGSLLFVTSLFSPTACKVLPCSCRFNIQQVLSTYSVPDIMKQNCRERGIRKVGKCLPTRLSARAEHSCKRDVQLRILCSRGKRTFLAHKDISLIPQKEQTQGQMDSKLIKKFPKTKS